jgi:hypothetical protein
VISDGRRLTALGGRFCHGTTVLMARGLTTPMPVIIVGVLGGTIAFGIVGLFFGPIVISVGWTVMVAWLQGTDSPQKGTAEPSMVKTPGAFECCSA